MVLFVEIAFLRGVLRVLVRILIRVLLGHRKGGADGKEERE